MSTALDPTFDEAVLTMAAKFYPQGYTAVPDAPDTYEKLTAAFDAGRFVVWNGASGTTIYASPKVNFAFRAWHDWCHWQGKYPFTMEGERAVYFKMCQQLVDHFGMTERVRGWCTILRAEVMGQQLYQQRYGTYPDDQRAFVQKFLEDPLIFAPGQSD